MNKGGAPKTFETPEELWDLFQEYCEWAKSNPYRQQDYVGKDGKAVYRDKERWISFKSFQGWLAINGICYDLSNYEKQQSEHHKRFYPMLTRIHKVVEMDMLDGAAAGVFNSNMTSRVLQLADNQNNKVFIESWTEDE